MSTENSNDNNEWLPVVIGALIGLAVLAMLWWSVPKLWGWWINVWQSPESNSYCKHLKKVIKAEPLYEDNGKHEDESYRVTYDDGTVGLLENSQMESGNYCVSQDWMTETEAKQRGYVLKP